MSKKSRELAKKTKVPLSRCSSPDVGSGRINAPHGGRYYMCCQKAIKKANPARVGEHPSPTSNEEHRKYRDCFWKGNKKAELFSAPLSIYQSSSVSKMSLCFEVASDKPMTIRKNSFLQHTFKSGHVLSHLLSCIPLGLNLSRSVIRPKLQVFLYSRLDVSCIKLPIDILNRPSLI